MAQTMPWRTLELGDELPPLLVKTAFDRGGYELQLTDLSRIWGESLSKNEIVDKASENGCSIDPSEDDQYQILLEKIGSAVRADKGTTLDLHSIDNGHELQLDLSAPLPGSLPTFKWKITLIRMPDATVGTELMTPLLKQATQLRQQIQQLIDELASKDRVIAKITDRLETSGNDLTAVFPGVSNIKTSRKKSQRAQLASHVKGLADFDEGIWRASLKQSDESIGLSPGLLNDVLESLPVSERRAHANPDIQDWWTELSSAGSRRQMSQANNVISDISHGSANATNQQQKCTANGEPVLSTEDSMVDDEFQRQGTPPQLRTRDHSPDNEGAETDAGTDDGMKPQISENVDDAETDDDDLDAVPSHPSSSQTKGRSQKQEQESNPASSHVVAIGTRKLGVLGGRKSKSPQPPSQTQPEAEPEADPEDEEVSKPEAKPKGRLGAFGGKTKTTSPAPEPEQMAEAESKQVSPPMPRSRLGAFGGKSKTGQTSSNSVEEAEPAAKPKSKLGTFGGKSKKSSESASVKDQEVEDDTQPAPTKAKLGRTGGKSASSERNKYVADPEPERQPRAPERLEREEEQEREDSQERADKKRERLKRELEEKAKGPAKKKRKF